MRKKPHSSSSSSSNAIVLRSGSRSGLPNRAFIQTPSSHKPVHQAEQQHKGKYRTGVVHVLGRHRLSRGERKENANKDRVHDGEDINVQSQGTEPERTVRDRLVAELAHGENDDGDEIGYVEGERGQGEDGVECRTRSDVDEAQQADHHPHEHDRPDRNLVIRIHLRSRQLLDPLDPECRAVKNRFLHMRRNPKTEVLCLAQRPRSNGMWTPKSPAWRKRPR